VKVLDRNAVVRGAVVGLVCFVPLSALRVVADRNVDDFDASGWAPVFALALFAVYLLAGFVAGRLAADAPLSNGIVGAISAFVLWIPVRIVIWALRDSGVGLVTGSDPVFTPARLLGQVVFAAFFGALGGFIARRRRSTATT
jgi:hypothetical protein